MKNQLPKELQYPKISEWISGEHKAFKLIEYPDIKCYILIDNLFDIITNARINVSLLLAALNAIKLRSLNRSELQILVVSRNENLYVDDEALHWIKDWQMCFKFDLLGYTNK